MAIRRKSIDKLLKFKNPKCRTSITKIEPNQIITRGYPQEDLIGNISFPEMVYLLITGDLPSDKESKMLEAVLVSFCDHGLTPPSTQVARLMASTGSPLNNCVSGGILSFGKHHAGALERCMKLLQEAVREGVKGYEGPIESAKDLKIMAEVLVENFNKTKSKIPGFGHRYHNQDPRSSKLIKVAKKNDFCGIHTQLAMNIQNILSETKNIRLNVDGANAGILSDMGFDWQIGTGIFMIGRLPGLISHTFEEQSRESPFRKLFEVDDIYYDGLAERTSNKDIETPDC